MFFFYVDNKLKDTFEDLYCPTSKNEKYGYISTKKILVSTTVKSAKPAVTSLIFHSRNKN